MTTRFNPLDHRIALSHPERLTPHSGWTEHIPFGMLLVELLRPRVIVELGTQHGDSYCAFCQAVAELHLDARCHAVDTWTGDEHSGTYGPEVLADLRAHHDPRYAGFSELLQCTFDEASERFEPGSIDLLHIDGYHTYDVVGHDLETWLPKMSARGVVLLHDTNVRRADFGVWRVLSEAKERFEHFELLHGHGLGLLVVGSEPPEPVRLLTRASDGDRQAIREHFHRLGERLAALARVGSLTEEAAAREHRIVALTHQASELSKLAADQRAAIEAKDVFIAELQHRAGEAEGLRRMIDEVDRDRASARDALVELRARHTQQTAALSRAHEAEREAAERAQGEALAELERQLAGERGRIAAERARLEHELAGAHAALRALTAQHEDARRATEAERGARQRAEAELAGANAELARIAELEQQVSLLSAHLEHVEQSTGFRLVKLQRDVMDRVLPVHSRRRAPYVSASRLIGRLLGAGREPETEPPPIAPASAPRIGARAAHPIAPADQAAKASLQVTHPRIVRIARRPLEERISVVIPTKNGEAEGLNDTLRALRHQRGAGDVEIVVVDSGSTDATLEIAGDWGATIVEIPPAEFNHGGTRNFGFDLAKGDLVAFTVQDAILGADDALYELAKLVVDDPQVAVASVRQVPRATADLFACWQHHSLFAGLGVQTRKGRVDPLRLRHLPGGERWRLGYVDDVFAIHRREVFESLRYRTIEHAEDAEYGQRVLESGRAVAFLGTRAVIHSHDRSDRYHLKNYYVSRMVMGPMLGDVDPTRWDKTRIGSFAELVEGARAVYAGLNGLAASIELEREHDLAAFRESLGVLLAHPAAGVAEAPAGSELAAVMDALGEVAGSGAADREAPDPSKFRLVYEWNVDNLLWPYLSTRYRKLDGMDLVQVLYKMFGCTLGADLANYVLAPPVATDAGALDRAIRAAIAEVGRG